MHSNNKNNQGVYNRSNNRSAFPNNFQDYNFASDYYNNSYVGYPPVLGHAHNFQHFRDREQYLSNKWRNYDLSKESRGNSRGQKPFRDRRRDRERPQRERSSSNNSNSSNVPNSEQESKQDCKLYICPSCQTPYECYPRSGKVPLILTCQHTLCQECLLRSSDNTVECPVCKSVTTLPQNFNSNSLQDTFSPNFYLYGMLLWNKSQSNTLKDLALAPVPKTVVKKPFDLDIRPEITATCCFINCNKRAVLNCRDCNDVYCEVCSVSVHQSAKSLWSHRQVKLSEGNIFVKLDKCKEHNMDMEIYCKDCEEGTCCYCFLEKHEGHEKDYLAKLTESDQAEFGRCRAQIEKNFRQLLISQKKIKDLHYTSTSTVEKKITATFVDLHSKLQCIEKMLRAQVSTMNDTGKSLKGLENINWKINSSIQEVKQVLLACEVADEKKVNLREILKKMQEVVNIPCYLLKDQHDELEPISLSVDPAMDQLETYFKITKSDDSEYLLVTEDALPEDYQKSDIPIDNDADTTSILSDMKKSVKSSTKKKKSDGSDYMNKFEKEMVEVTHIESLEKFYVQQKKMQYRLLQMNKDIENYVPMAAMVDQPQLNDLYIVQYVTNKEKMWCRGRIVDVTNGETEPLYEVFFIDYGTTQLVDMSKLREITSSLAHKKAFAIQCELYNPTYVSWNKNAHVYMGRIINGKELCMMVKAVQSGIHQVDLMISSSDGGFTSIIDLLMYACKNALTPSSDDSFEATNNHNYYTQDCKIFSNNTKFQKNQIETVTIANIVDPHHICVHNASHADSFKKMISSMRSYYKKKKNTSIPVEGSYVVVESKDPIRGNWHRAFIKKVDISTETVHVKCVDWGNNLVVPFSSIRMLTENFTKLESQAIYVKMAHIEPFKRAHVWPDKAAIYLQRFFRNRDVLKMIVDNEDPLEVALFQMETDMDRCINTMLVQENLADSTGKISKILEWPQNVAKQPSFSESDGFVDAMLKRIHDSCDENESEDEEEKKLLKQKIEVVKFVNPDLIYIKFVAREETERTMLRELQVHYQKEKETKEIWNENEPCVIVYKKMYARGIILGQQDGKYKVNVIDNVDEVLVSIDNIFVYAPYFKKYSSIVFKAYLANIKPSGGDKWSLSSIEALDKIFQTHKEEIFATKVSSDGLNKALPMKMWYIKVIIGGALEASVTKYISINNFLVKLGFAYKKFVDPSEEHLTNDKESKVETEDILNASNSSTDSKDWNKIIEDEEKRVEEENKQESPYHTREADIKSWEPSFPIDKPEFDAYITCAEMNGILFVRDVALQTVYEKLEENIKEYFDNKQDKGIDEKYSWQPGMMCTIAYQDSWYRGQVVAVENPDDIIVTMIDFGSEHNVKAKDLCREILYPDITAFASKIKLDRIYPKSGKWLTSDYETLREILTEHSRIEIKSSPGDEIPSAEIYNNLGINVNEALVKKCPNLTRQKNWKQPKHSDDEDVLIEMEESLEIKGSPVDTTGFKFKVAELTEADECTMFILAIIKYNMVVMQKPRDKPDIRVRKLIQDILKYAEFQPVIETIELNMPCIAKYSEDNCWYRAQVYNVDGLNGGYVLVYYVDFGNIESVLTSEIRMMRPEWFDLPITSYMAELNFKLKTENHLEYVFQVIRKLFGKTLRVQFVKREPLIVNLLEKNGDLVYQPLISSGFIEVVEAGPDVENSSI